MADPAVVFFGGGGDDLAKRPKPGTPKLKNSVDLGHHFLEGAKIHYRKMKKCPICYRQGRSPKSSKI